LEEAAVAYLKILFRQLPGGNEVGHEITGMIVSSLAKIRTMYLLKTSIKHKGYSGVLSVLCCYTSYTLLKGKVLTQNSVLCIEGHLYMLHKVKQREFSLLFYLVL
jgi:hypothetical protein